MPPYVAAMTPEETLGLQVGSPVGEGKALTEVGPGEESEPCPQEGMDCFCHTTSMTHSPTSDSLSSEEPLCRICHEGGGVGELLSPCECAGSLAAVHRACLEHWLTASNSSRCELCHHQYSLERLPKPLTEWLGSPSMQHQRWTLCGDIICFLFITPLASLSGWLCVQGAMDLYYSNSTEAVGLIVLTLALFTIYCFWTLVSLRYHIHLFRTWKRTDQRVRLQMARPPPTPHTYHTLKHSFLSKDTNKETVV
ncbi:E3 ubiquitin-protein ligase MARCH3 isoform X2 [Esox lucius]|nr:E3 ubiquitin-protein ligase MARCH3 isoform X2 [Esox lucius]XP_019911824.1 E3 ubiquitin-protein ligase MARCH3 isoform X2 [Esox lucius]XP_019911827.1 E3 ubiquitin-protein ligase MARCH3 isoform X2 [Esox lucius]XP_034153154.1 E3 ubiquitin-protein ligase MARCH3 isoform X2 [Esox lucius]XP_034153157.1 E3 ubiquitin-protein ligase MARCH3 isoform X2 [Esox lucius]XP_034153167.1 E3 ubiquitin-protein ligase MARCH3 isoform X2 [Esox lucius]